VNSHDAHSYWKQSALGTAGVWAGAGLHHALGLGHTAQLPTHLVSVYNG